MSLESPESYYLEHAVNTIKAKEFISSQIDKVSFKDVILQNIRDKGLVNKDFEDSFIKDDLSSCINSTDKYDLLKLFEHMLEGAYDDLYKELESIDYDFVVVQNYASPKPEWVTHSVLWITPYNPSHMIEHEGLDEATARILYDTYSDVLRSKKDEFDKFFDREPLNVVIDYIRNL